MSVKKHEPLSRSLSLTFTIIVITSRRNDIFSVPINPFYHLSEDLLCFKNRQDWYSSTALGRETSQWYDCEGNAGNFLAKTQKQITVFWGHRCISLKLAHFSLFPSICSEAGCFSHAVMRSRYFFCSLKSRALKPVSLYIEPSSPSFKHFGFPATQPLPCLFVLLAISSPH